MAYTPQFEKIKTSLKKNIDVVQNTIDCKLPATDGSSIVKILSANCTAYIVSAEYDNGTIKYVGTAKFQVIYESDDGATFGLDYTAEFGDKVNYDVEVVPVVSTSVIDVKATNSASDVKIIATMETTIEAVENTDTDVLVGVGDENESFVKREEQEYISYVGQINEKFDVSQDIDIKDEVSKVLTVSNEVSLMEAKVYEGYVALKGEVCVNICYYSGGLVRSQSSSIPFTEEVAFEGLNDISRLMSNVTLGSDVVVGTTLDQDHAIVNVSVPVYYLAQVFSENKIDMVVDVFSPNNMLELSTASVESLDDIENYVTHEKIDGSISITDEMPFIDEVLGTSASRVVVARQDAIDGELLVEGVAYTTVLYLNKELGNVSSLDVEMPFSISSRIDADPETQSNISVAICDVTAKGKRGKEIEVYAHLEVYANLYSSDTFGVITKLNVGEEIPLCPYGLSLYFVKDNETIWDISKELKVSPESILEQNPTLNLPLKAGDKIFVYRRLNR